MRYLRAVRTNFLIDRASNRSFESCSGHFYDPFVRAVNLVVLLALGNPEARRVPMVPCTPRATTARPGRI
jgi:hypothetical protein